MRRGQASPKRVTASEAQLTMLLNSCTDAALAQMTSQGLAATHRVPLLYAEYALTIARQRRAERG